MLRQETRLDGALGWAAAFDGALCAEADADAYIARARSQDPDLWAVEIESADGWSPFSD